MFHGFSEAGFLSQTTFSSYNTCSLILYMDDSTFSGEPQSPHCRKELLPSDRFQRVLHYNGRCSSLTILIYCRNSKLGSRRSGLPLSDASLARSGVATGGGGMGGVHPPRIAVPSQSPPLYVFLQVQFSVTQREYVRHIA